ncbi:MAG: hypothetical protein ACRCZ6_17585 [Kluyvera sp.]|uniref:hypothetical protein n=1 Tax=Kluyvera sp. TaxID=1538228 RepID=UPI003F378CD7
MRIRERQSPNGYASLEQESSASLLKSQQAFNSLFQSPPRAGGDAENEDNVTERLRLTACFKALMQDKNARYHDSHVSITRTGEGQLSWRLLSGAMQGCTLYVRWRHKHISVEITAPAMLAKRLLKRREGIEQRLAQRTSHFLVDIKITGESDYV